MHLVPKPVEIALFAITHLLVVWRAIPRAHRHHLLGREPLGMSVDLPILLGPGLLEDADGRQFFKPAPLCLGRSLRKTSEQSVAVLANGRTERVAFGLVFG